MPVLRVNKKLHFNIMKPETERLLGTLEVLSHNPSSTLFWETEIEGEFSLLKFMQQQGFIKLTDLEVAAENWRETELRGTAGREDYYAPEPDYRNNLFDEETKAFRSEKYSLLLEKIASNLEEIEAFIIGAHHLEEYSEWSHPYYDFCVVIGKTKDKDWLCLAPSVCNEVFYSTEKYTPKSQPKSTESFGKNTKKVLSQIRDIISELTPTMMYGYYGGGYNHTYNHQIFCEVATNKASAFEKALSQAGMLKITDIEEVEHEDSLNSSSTINPFLNSELYPLHAYYLAFWDIGYIYKVGQNSVGDWLGVSLLCEFEFNP
ncbi:MAG: hypothetical protein SXA11_11745 [Cyanobacteriota bacterium]|nr:hypothetical protein [Cyanobacteriota bacterium]